MSRVGALPALAPSRRSGPFAPEVFAETNIGIKLGRVLTSVEITTMNQMPPFRADHVGSLLRPDPVIAARRAHFDEGFA